MGWIKNVLIDILVTVVIAVYAFTSASWGYWIIVIYTPLMLLLKFMAVLSGASRVVKQKQQESAPAWFFHMVYAVNVLLLLYANWWLLAVGWAGIWLLSAVQASRTGNKDAA